MEAKKDSARKSRLGPKASASTSPAAKVFSLKPKVQELPNAPRLVGRIVEKGFSPGSDSSSLAPSSLPQPTVLPFPVARHRSHGPYPSPTIRDQQSFEEEMDLDMDETDYDPLAAFANPIQKKEKKKLDISQWRDFIPSKTKKRLVRDVPMHDAQGESSQSIREEIDSENIARLNEMSAEEIAEAQKEIMEKMNPALVEMLKRRGKNKLEKRSGSAREKSEEEKEKDFAVIEKDFISNKEPNPSKTKKRVVKPSPQTTEKETNEINIPLIRDVPMHDAAQGESSQNPRPASLKEEIDSENTARLNEMSGEEISEAQKELMEKMDPALVEMLKRRGKNKLEKRSGSESEKSEEVKEKDFGVKAGDLLKQPQGRVSGDVVWRDWSDRVERVRYYRFNLNGDVLGIDSSLEQKDGSKHQPGHYNPDSVAERDFLRTEGDPAAIGYTINEAVSLTRSVVPGQRALALQLLSSMLNKGLHNLEKEGCVSEKGVDWQAVWAFALGPEPQLAFSLRMALDDNHESVVLAGARAIQSLLSFDMNENYFDISEKLPVHERHICTAPVFRSRPDLRQGFLRGGFWKYNTKTSNLLPDLEENEKEEGEDGEGTVKDDMVVAEQDVAAGLIRMSILPRICYLLEMEPHPNLEDALISILVALARHSPQSSDAILRCPRLIQAVSEVLKNHQMAEICSSQIKVLTLLKVLSKYSKKTCFELINHGIIQLAFWNLYKGNFTFNNWISIGGENLKLYSSMLVEQFRLWRVYINHGLSIPRFTDFFPVLRLFLDPPPSFEKLVDENALEEFASVTSEAYLVLYDLALTLPVLHSSAETGVEKDTWKWSDAIPIMDLAVKWLELKTIPLFPLVVSRDQGVDNARGCSLLWVFSSIFHMLNGILQKIAPVEDRTDNRHELLPWLPNFVPMLGLAVINGFLEQNKGSVLKRLYEVRKFNKNENTKSNDVILASTSCIRGLVQVASSIDNLVQRAKNACTTEPQVGGGGSMPGGELLATGIVNWARDDLSEAFSMVTLDISLEWHVVQCVEVFGRGGPAPGIGFGWGSKGGGFWSVKSLLTRLDSRLFLDFIEILNLGINVAPGAENLRMINSLLEVCLMAGPADRTVLEKAMHMLFQAPVLKYLALCINYYIPKIVGSMAVVLNFSEDEFSLFSEALVSHFKTRWLDVKKKSKKDVKRQPQPDNCLETIHEETELKENTDGDTSRDLMVIEWAHQRLPLPAHWVLSPLCGSADLKVGLFLLLGLETLLHISDLPSSPLSEVSLVWKLHSLSMCLSSDMDVLGEEKSRAMFEIIQEMYSRELQKPENKALDFQTQINENYSTFVEHLIEQFAAVSYGDVLYGRQVAVYLHRKVETSVRLNAWNVLASASVLELLPPLERCVGGAHGYLEPAEDNEGILEAYAKSWISGGLDRAANRKSVAFTLVVHHLSSFIFDNGNDEKQVMRSKLVKSLLRYYSQKRQSEGMLKGLIENALDVSQEKLYRDEISRRFEVLKACCEGNSSLLVEVERLRSVISL